MTINELFNEWLELRRIRVKESTISAYNLLYVNYIHSNMGNESVKELNKKRLQAFYNNMTLNGKLSQKSTQDIMIVLKSMCRLAMDEGYIPFFSYKIEMRPPRQKKRVQVYTKDEQKMILDHVKNNATPRNIGIALVLCSGMRIGEIAALKWGDIDIGRKVVIVNKTMQRIYTVSNNVDQERKKGKTKIVTSDPKTSSSEREIPIAKGIFELLKTYKKIMPDSFYVSSGDKKPIEPRVYRAYYGKLMKEIGISNIINFHGLRHTKFCFALKINKLHSVKSA